MPIEPPNTEERYWPAGGRKEVRRLTRAAFGFVEEHSRLLDLHVFIAQARLRHVETAEGETDRARELLLELNRQEELLSEVILCRVVDNFLTFISELLALIYTTRPEMLRSSEQERLDYVLQFQSMDELRSALAEKRVERLAYLGLRDLSEHFRSQMGFELFPVPDHLQHAALMVEYRNLFVHNRGVVSAISTRRFPELKNGLGERLRIETDRVRELRQFLENAMFDIDIRASAKFGLPVTQLPEPPSHLVG